MFLFRPFGLISIGTHLWTEDSILEDTTLCICHIIKSLILLCIVPSFTNLLKCFAHCNRSDTLLASRLYISIKIGFTFLSSVLNLPSGLVMLKSTISYISSYLLIISL